MYSSNDFRNYSELRHHGIMGQKWGVRNGPPYPLAEERHNKSEQKARWKSSLTKAKENKGTDTSSEGLFHHPILDNERINRRGNKKYSNSNDQNFIEAEERVRNSDGAVVYPPVGAMLRDWTARGDNPYPGPKGFEGLYDRVNPNYGENGTTNNCPFVGAAMEIASRGFAVVARRSLGGVCATAFEEWFKGAKTEYCDTWDEMKQDILNDGDGASGVLQGYYGKGLGDGMGGHTLHWRNEGGKIKVADGQDHTEWDFDQIVNQYGFGSKGCIRTRLDNCDIDWDKITEDGVVGVDNKWRRWKFKPNNSVYNRF